MGSLYDIYIEFLDYTELPIYIIFAFLYNKNVLEIYVFKWNSWSLILRVTLIYYKASTTVRTLLSYTIYSPAILLTISFLKMIYKTFWIISYNPPIECVFWRCLAPKFQTACFNLGNSCLWKWKRVFWGNSCWYIFENTSNLMYHKASILSFS